MTKSKLLIVCGLILAITTSAAINNLPKDYFQAIVDRKAFGLSDPPPPPKPEPVKPSQVVGLKLSGITTLGGVKKAYLVVPDPEKQPPNPAYNRYPCIKEGDQDLGIEVLQIDETAGAVKIRNNGVPMELTFALNGNTANPVALPATINAPGGPIVMNPAMPGVNPAPVQGVPPPPGIMRNPTIITQPPNIPNQVTPSFNTTIPPRTPRTGAQVNPAADQAAFVQSSLLIEMQREANKAAIASGAMPPLPPTDFTEAPPANQPTATVIRRP